PILRSSRGIIHHLLSLGTERMQRASWLFNFNKEIDLQRHIFSQEQFLFSAKEVSKLMVIPVQKKFFVKSQLSRKLHPDENQALFDIQNYLSDDLLHKVDMASMHHSLEVRVPLLDHKVVEFSLNLNRNLKKRGNVSKYLLKQILYEYLPAHLFDRAKRGFSVPLAKWLRNDLAYLLENYLSEQIIREAGLVKWSIVASIKAKFKAGKSLYYNRLWALILLHKWWKDNQ
ncbi:MAG: hypothetical protein HKN48_11475, partial [Flavobacteriaceae bacterium]|nr:hypothetical protein [Flavobacteriaceae bacterium]